MATLEEIGDFHRASDGFGTATEYYDSALRALCDEAVYDVRAEARLNRKLADCHSSRGFLQEGLQFLDRAQKCLAGCEGEVEYAVVMGARAHILTLVGDWRTSLECAQAAIEMLKPTSAHAEYAMVQAIAALCHGRLGNPKEFEELSTDALATYRRIDDQAGIAKINNNLGIAYKNACQWEKAIGCLGAALDINEHIGRGRGLARVLTNLGNVYTKTHRYEEALAYLQRGRRLAQSLGDPATLTSSLNSLGHALVLMGRYTAAEKHLHNARVLAERHQFGRSCALADEFLGDLRQAQGRYEEAQENYESGLRQARAIAPRGDIVGEILRRVAELQLKQGLRSQAISTAKRALGICRECDESYELGFIWRTLALALEGVGKHAEARQAFAESIGAFEATHVPVEVARTRMALAQVLVQDATADSCSRAVSEAQQAGDTFRQVHDSRSWCDANLVLAEAHATLGNHDDGLLVLSTIERLCEKDDNLVEKSRRLRQQVESDLISQVQGDTHRLNLISSLTSLPAEDDTDDETHRFLQSLAEKTHSAAAFLSVGDPSTNASAIKGVLGVAASEAVQLAIYFAGSTRLQMLSSMNQEFSGSFPQVTARSSGVLVHPLVWNGKSLGTLYLERASGSSTLYSRDELVLISTYANLAAEVLGEVHREDALDREKRQKLDPETLGSALAQILTRDAGMYEVLDLVRKVAPSSCTVMLSGETGTGKGLIAKCLHRLSRRRGDFIAINCAAMPESLLESELFGHSQGAFTGADRAKVGLLQAADGGTVFLDEIGKTSIAMQGKLLQFLDNSTVRPVGSNEFRLVDVRILCASKADLKILVDQGDFLEDLYYRLSDFPIHIPPLRNRRGDVRLLVEHFLRKNREELNKKPINVSRRAMQLLQAYSWPGNVRELSNCIKRAVVLVDAGQTIAARHLTDAVQAMATGDLVAPSVGLGLRDQLSRLEARLIDAAMRKAEGNKSEAARMLHVSYPTLLQKLKLRKDELDQAAQPAD